MKDERRMEINLPYKDSANLTRTIFENSSYFDPQTKYNPVVLGSNEIIYQNYRSLNPRTDHKPSFDRSLPPKPENLLDLRLSFVTGDPINDFDHRRNKSQE